MKFHEEKGIGFCGLACVLCSAEDCVGCHHDGCANKDRCNIYQCCKEKGIIGCWECSAFPCEEKMLENIRIRAFVHCAKEDGIPQLLSNLQRNYTNGIVYHSPTGSKGDYDQLDTEAEIIHLIRTGKRI